MKLTDQIKEKIDNAQSKEEVKTILDNVKDGAEEAGVILDDDELDQVAGGEAPANSFGWLPGRGKLTPEELLRRTL